MNAHFQRASMLMEQSRYALAENELRQALAQDPDDGMAHAMLGLCLSNLEKYDEAQQEVESAIHILPDQPFAFYVYASVLLGRNDFKQARSAIETAIGLDPYSQHHFAMLARIEFQLQNWQAAVDAAESGLELDPENVECTNLRAVALVRLGKNIAAQEALQTALKRAPEDPFSHANLGWSLLESNEPQKAMEHFREALRLDPELEWARSGIVEAMKARFFIYRMILSWFLWMAKLQEKAQFGVIIGAFLGYQILSRIARNNPGLAPWIYPLLIVYVVFALMTWLSAPLFNLVLRTNKFGRLALSDEQIRTSTWVGVCVLGSVGMLIAYCFAGSFEFLGCALAFALIIPPISRVYHCSPGWPRSALALISIALGIWGAIISLCLIIGMASPESLRIPLFDYADTFFLPFIYSSIAAQFGTNFFASAQPRLGTDKGERVWKYGLVAITLATLAMFAVVVNTVVAPPKSEPVLFSMPITLRLTAADDVPWSDPELLAKRTKLCEDLGFQVMGDFRADSWKDNFFRLAFSKDRSTLVEMTENGHTQFQVAFSTFYEDGTVFTASNAIGQVTKSRPAKTFQAFDLETVELYETFLALRPKDNQRILDNGEIIDLLANEYDADMSFQLSRGGPNAAEFKAIGESVNLTFNDQQIKRLQTIWRGQAAEKLHAHAIDKLIDSGELTSDGDGETVFGISGLMSSNDVAALLSEMNYGNDRFPIQQIVLDQNQDLVGDDFRARFEKVVSSIRGLKRVSTVESPIPVDVYIRNTAKRE